MNNNNKNNSNTINVFITYIILLLSVSIVLGTIISIYYYPQLIIIEKELTI